MLFAPDTEVALRSVVNLINSAANGDEQLATTQDLDRFLAASTLPPSRPPPPVCCLIAHTCLAPLCSFCTLALT